VHATTVIVGLGSEVRSDDGVGIRIIRRLERLEIPDGIALVAAGTPGLGILDLIAGYRRLVIVDAADAGFEPGTVLEWRLGDVNTRLSLNASATHGIDLPAAIAAGRKLGLPLPDDIHIVGVQVEDATTLSERCTARVRAAIDEAARSALAIAATDSDRPPAQPASRGAGTCPTGGRS
jgi:hydrogenase maturation protease